jgi:hypothetical protein
MSKNTKQKNAKGNRRDYVVSALTALAIISTVMYSHSLTPSAKPVTGAQARTDSASALPPQQWIGRKFMVLDKPRLFRKFGYELYLTKDLSTSVKHIDTSTETDRHHLRYDLGCRTVLAVTAVEPVAGEWLVGFSQEKTGRVLYAKTHKGGIEGIACMEDIDKAATMWTGRTVYSRRRFIDTYDTASGTFGTVKVNIQDRLAVTAVRWGTTPLPPKPLWLCVTTADKEAGIIPISQTWTNVMTDKITGAAPWDDDIFEKNPMEIYSWDSLTWKAINSHTIVSGMTKEQVRVSWGLPHNIVKDTSASLQGAHPAAPGGGKRCAEEWRYGSQFLCFDHDTVVTVGAQ